MPEHSTIPVEQSAGRSWKHAETQRVADLLKAISHPLRLSIVCILSDGPLCVNQIHQSIGTSQANISQHLHNLANRRLLLTEKQANKVYYRLSDARLIEIIGMLREIYCR
jgi:ArsR family transcriptional regulator